MQSPQPDSLSLAAFRAVPLGAALGVVGVVLFLATLVGFSFFGLGLAQARTGTVLGTTLVAMAALLYARHARRHD